MVMVFYAVYKGVETGVFSTWEQTKPLVQGFSGAKYKKFNDYMAARLYSKYGESERPSVEQIRSLVQTNNQKPQNNDEENTWTFYVCGLCHPDEKQSVLIGITGLLKNENKEEINCMVKDTTVPTTCKTRAELVALLHVLHRLKDHLSRVVVYTNSIHGYNCIHRYFELWTKTCFHTHLGKEVQHFDLIYSLFEFTLKHKNIIVRHDTGISHMSKHALQLATSASLTKDSGNSANFTWL